ncbi:glycoside hydrolase family 5 protein [Plicaturopsis crispa FD-325 SS-3]|nr:glycoside hydrolase family 5 protein [Plicaturopsis crispa FD-325 SS-3]
MRSFFVSLSLLISLVCRVSAAASLPDKIYGVNLGSWLVLESWMLPQEWLDMGGEKCKDCSECIATEFAFAEAYPDTVDDTFAQHWSTWFTQADVDALQAAGINTVRIPLGYWILEELVDRSSEYYPRGGISYLRSGLRMLQDAGITVILDHHGLPGVQTPNSMFTGRCTSDAQFYTPYNYGRALTWSAVMTALSHLDPAFASVASIEAVNEPIMDATQTPGYGDFQKNFVRVVRAVELILGIPATGLSLDLKITTSNFTAALIEVNTGYGDIFNAEVLQALGEAAPILLQLGVQFTLDNIFDFTKISTGTTTPLVTSFMDVSWQYNNPSNPADAKIGPQGYDNHLYYSFGGVADANEDAYLTSICNLQRVQSDSPLGNSPLWFGEWGLPTQFNATDAFLVKWADAQKLAYTEGKGWIFWNFKIETSKLAGNLSRQWSYMEGLRRGYLTKDPSQLYDPHVCDQYRNAAASFKEAETPGNTGPVGY